MKDRRHRDETPCAVGRGTVACWSIWPLGNAVWSTKRVARMVRFLSGSLNCGELEPGSNSLWLAGRESNPQKLSLPHQHGQRVNTGRAACGNPAPEARGQDQ